MVGVLNRIHFTPSDAGEQLDNQPQCLTLSHGFNLSVPALLESVQPTLYSCREVTAGLASIVPANQFWRWKDMWSNSLRTAVFAAVLVEYLSSRDLASLPKVSEQLGSRSFSGFVSVVGPEPGTSEGGMERSCHSASRGLSSRPHQCRQRIGMLASLPPPALLPTHLDHSLVLQSTLSPLAILTNLSKYLCSSKTYSSVSLW